MPLNRKQSLRTMNPLTTAQLLRDNLSYLRHVNLISSKKARAKSFRSETSLVASTLYTKLQSKKKLQ